MFWYSILNNMLKHHIKGTDVFEIDPIVNQRLLLSSKYDNIIEKIGYSRVEVTYWPWFYALISNCCYIIS